MLRKLLAASILAGAPLGAQSSVPLRAIDPRNIDRSFGACRDFYMFATNGWTERNPIPDASSTWGPFSALTERHALVLRTIAERAAAQAAATDDAATGTLGTFYASCMDSTAAERAGIAPIDDELRRIAAITSRDVLQDQIGRMLLRGYGGPFAFGAAADARNPRLTIADVSQSGLGLPDRDHYLREDSASNALRARYLERVAAMLRLGGDSDAAATATAARILDLETALARAQLPRIAFRDANAGYHPMTLEQASALTPGLEWRRIVAALGLTGVTTVNLGAPAYYTALGAELASRPIEDWKGYLRWTVLRSTAPHLSAPFADEAFRLASMLSGVRVQEPRWRRCLATSDQLLGDALGREYVKSEFTPEARRKMLTLVADVRAVMRERIARADWMGASTRTEALRKLDALGQKIGYPDEWRSYAGLDLEPGPFASNLVRARAFAVRNDLARIGRPAERERWLMTPQTVNAYYSMSRNEIVFPAGRLQPPFFSVTYDDAANYGGIGAAIGHELTHGFDDAGRRYDAEGSVRDWWAPDDERRYRERADLIERQYGAYVVIDTFRLDGRLTLGENIADNLGVSVAYQALERALRGKPHTKIDGFTPEQRFFLAYAQSRLSEARPEALRAMRTTSVHAPGRFRVNGPLANMPEFARAFGCKPGDPMVRPATARELLW